MDVLELAEKLKSKKSWKQEKFGGMAERRGKGLQIPLHGFKSRFHLERFYLR